MKLLKKLLSLLLCAVMVLGSVAIGGNGFAGVLDALSVKASAAKVTSYKTGDIIEFGWYPQSKETNKSITDALTSSAGNTLGWNSYNYYSGTGSYTDGQMTPSNYMRYTDVMYGSTKYRGVIFDSYRPYYTGYTSSTTQQDVNGYKTGNVYWFKYEPIKWRVLDPATGMVMAETILDSQAFNNYILSSGSDKYGYTAYWGDSSKTYYANNYTESTIRKWLNDDFYNTAFSPAQQNIIHLTGLDNSAYSASYSAYNSAATYDKIYLLSYNDALNADYGFSPSNDNHYSRNAQGSDYAKCQGLYVSSGDSSWRLRSPSGGSRDMCCVGINGSVTNGRSGDTNLTFFGVRPALNFNLSSDIFQSEVKDTGTAAGSGTGNYSTGDYIYYGTYPQSEVTDSALVSALNGASGSWKSYGYYSGTGDWDDGRMKPSDYMRYKDVSYNGSKYRAVIFDSYRPYYTGYTSSASNTFQDDNGYKTGNVYWFKYEPIKWRVLDPSTGLIMCDTAIDSQAYNNFIWHGVGSLSSSSEHYGDEAHTYYASNYAKSSIRAWLNKDFYNTAFSSDQKSNIVSTTLDSGSTWSPAYDAPSTTDKIFLLLYNDSINSNYGFSSSDSDYDTARQLKSTDYAKCQGCFQNTSDSYRGNCWWWLRSPYYSGGSNEISDDGNTDHNFSVSLTHEGVVPALRLSNLKSDYAGSEIGAGDEDIAESVKVPFYVSRNRSVTLNTSWSNADFEKDNSQYNHTLAVNSLLLSKATETSEFRAKEIYSDYFGFSNIRSVDYATDDLFSPAVTFASKEANGSLIVSMAIRGSTTTGDWATDALSQVILKDGFLTTINKETDALVWYIDDINNFYGNKYNWQNIKIHITGHSYGAAVAEGVAMGIVNKGASARNVYAYTFASPNVAEIKNSTDNPGLFNIINVNDAVPYVPVNAGYSHYGKTLYYTSNDSRNTAAFNKMFSNFDGLNVIEEHSLATYLAMMITTAPSGSVNLYTLNDLNSASIVSYKQTHTVDASVYNGYSAKYLNGAGSALYNAEKTDFCVPGLTENMIPQAIAHMKYGGKNWILIGAYDEKGVQPGVIYALDYNTGEFVAQFNVYNHDGSKNLGHMGGIAVSDYNLYISDSIPGEGSSIGYIPLDELLVDKYAKKNITIVEDFYIGDQMNYTYPAFLSFSKDSSGSRILWTGNFYNKLYSEANYQTPADSVCNSLVIGFNLIGNNSENEFREFKNYGKQPNRKYVLRIPDAYHSIQGMAYSNGVVYLSCTPFKAASLGSALLTSAIYAFNADLSTTGVKNIREGNVAGIKNITGGENIFIENGYMYGVYESAAPSYTNVTGLKSDVVWKTDVKKMLKGANIHILNCPVDVEVTEKTTGDVVGRITNNIIDEEIAAKENAVVMATDGDTKMFWLSDPENYEIKVTGNGTGVLDYTVKSFDEEAAETGRVNYFEIPVTTNTLLTGNFVSTDETVTAADYILSGEEIITPDEVIEGSEKTFAVNISCGKGGSATESFQAVSGDYVDVNATPDSGYIFEGWYDADDKLVSSEQNYRFCVRADITLKAKFYKIVTITIKTNGHGTATESFTCKSGETFTINAIPDEGYSFNGWYIGDILVSDEVVYRFCVRENINLTAVFEEIIFNYTVTENGEAIITGTCGEVSGDISIPATIDGYPVTSIGDQAFYASAITGITIPNGVTSIGKYAFLYCGNLTEISIPDTVTRIDEGAFCGCASLEEIFIPSSVSYLGYNIFSGNNNLLKITVDDNSPYYSSDDYGVLYNKNKTGLLRYPTGSENTVYFVPDGVSNIDSCAFNGCEKIQAIILPDTVTFIGDLAFSSNPELKYVHIPSSVVTINGENFYQTGKDTYICSDKPGCEAEAYAKEHGIEFRICVGHISKEEAISHLEELKDSFVCDDAKQIIDDAITAITGMDDSGEIYIAMINAETDAAAAEKALADAKAAAESELTTAKNNAKSDEAKSALDTAIANVDKATNLNDVAEAKLNGLTNAENAEKSYDEKTKFDKVSIKTATEKTIDYRSIVSIKATATGVPEGYKLAIYLGSQKVAEGDNKSVSYEYGEIKSDLNYSVKVIDSNSKVQKDSNGNDLSKDGGKITVNAGFFKKLVAFFKGLFKSLPKVEVKP